jgi:hypothetical protein
MLNVVLEEAPDRERCCAPGPGTIRGLNRLASRELKYDLPQDRALSEMLPLYCEIRETFPDIAIDLSDVSNILCETDLMDG